MHLEAHEAEVELLRPELAAVAAVAADLLIVAMRVVLIGCADTRTQTLRLAPSGNCAAAENPLAE